MGYGYHNHIVVQLHNDGAVSGSASAVALASPKFYLPVKAELMGIYASCTAKNANKSDTIHVRAGGTNVTTAGIVMASGTTSATNTTILGNQKVHAAGTLFDATHNGNLGLTTTNLGITLLFRSRKA